MIYDVSTTGMKEKPVTASLMGKVLLVLKEATCTRCKSKSHLINIKQHAQCQRQIHSDNTPDLCLQQDSLYMMRSLLCFGEGHVYQGTYGWNRRLHVGRWNEI